MKDPLPLKRAADDPAFLSSWLQSLGLSVPASDAKALLFSVAARSLIAMGRGGEESALLYYIPGRIEILGKHTDYAGGRSIIAAAERGLCMAAAPRLDSCVTVADAASGERVEFVMGGEPVPRTGHWSNYPVTVARRVSRNFPGELRGADIAFASDLPPAAGLSSSSALITGFFLVFSSINALPLRGEYRENIADGESLAAYLGTIENGRSFGRLEGDTGVGTFGGSEDHAAIILSKPGMLHQYAYAPIRLERGISMPAGYTFAVGCSGVLSEKTGASLEKYNRLSRLAATLTGMWNSAHGQNIPCLADILKNNPDERITRFRGLIDSRQDELPFSRKELSSRLEHFLAENDGILPLAGDALIAGDMASFGGLVDDSQRLAETLLANQIPETAFLASSARDLGASAASAFGAGFGGTVWALVREKEAEDFLRRWSGRYAGTFPARNAAASFFTTGAGPAASGLHCSP